MKIRKLKEHLKTTRTICNHNNTHIYVSSPYIYSLISLDIRNGNIKYALDTFNKGLEAISDEELKRLAVTLKEMYDSGSLKEFIEGTDSLPNPIPVYCIQDYKMAKRYSEDCSYPNIPAEGFLIFENGYFKTPREAKNHFIRNLKSLRHFLVSNIEDHKSKLTELENELAKADEFLTKNDHD